MATILAHLMLCVLVFLTWVPEATLAARSSSSVNDDEYDDDYGDDDEDEIGTKSFQYDIEHALAPGDWKKRGSLSVTFSQTSRHGLAKFSSADTLSAPDKEAYNALLAKDQMYRVRLIPANSDAAVCKEDACILTSSIKACALKNGKFREQWILHSDVYGNVMALDLRTPLQICNDESRRPIEAAEEVKMQSKAKVMFGRNADAPKKMEAIKGRDGKPLGAPAFTAAAGGQGGEGGEVVDKATGEQKPPKSFFERNWMYIVPIGIYMALSLFGPPPAEGQAAGGGGGGGGGGKKK